jgi:hypothetical protein
MTRAEQTGEVKLPYHSQVEGPQGWTSIQLAHADGTESEGLRYTW